MMLQQRIQNLDDATAARLLTTIARARSTSADCEQEWRPELAEALQTIAGEDLPEQSAVSEGDLARAALLVLAEEPDNQEPLAALIDGPKAKSFDMGTIAIAGVVLIVLQTRVTFEWKDSKASLKIHKPSMSTTGLQSLAQKLLAFVGAGGG